MSREAGVFTRQNAALIRNERAQQIRVLVIKRIHVKLRLKAQQDQKETAERVHGMYAERCPVYQSLRAAIAITTELVFETVGS